jgi:hypothetical protein
MDNVFEPVRGRIMAAFFVAAARTPSPKISQSGSLIRLLYF